MKNIISFLIVSLLIFGCKKGQKILPDDIESHQLEPVVEFSSTDSVYYVPFGPGCPVAVPVDSSAQRNIDISADGVDDFSIFMMHLYEQLSDSNPCVNYKYSISAIGLEQNETAGIVDKNSLIHSGLNWSNSTSLMRKGYFGPGAGSVDFSDSSYLAVRVKNGIGYNYGWVLLTKENFYISIHKTAINRTNNNSIITGIE